MQKTLKLHENIFFCLRCKNRKNFPAFFLFFSISKFRFNSGAFAPPDVYGYSTVIRWMLQASEQALDKDEKGVQFFPVLDKKTTRTVDKGES